MLRIAQLQRDLMAFQECQNTAREFRSAVQIVSRPPDIFKTKLSLFEPAGSESPVLAQLSLEGSEAEV